MCAVCTPVVYRIGPAGATAALDIGLSNAAIATDMHINLYTICKSTVVVFVLLFGIAFKIQKPVSQHTRLHPHVPFQAVVP